MLSLTTKLGILTPWPLLISAPELGDPSLPLSHYSRIQDSQNPPTRGPRVRFSSLFSRRFREFAPLARPLPGCVGGDPGAGR